MQHVFEQLYMQAMIDSTSYEAESHVIKQAYRLVVVEVVLFCQLLFDKSELILLIPRCEDFRIAQLSSLSLYIYIYIYIYMCVCVCKYKYKYK